MDILFVLEILRVISLPSTLWAISESSNIHEAKTYLKKSRKVCQTITNPPSRTVGEIRSLFLAAVYFFNCNLKTDRVQWSGL